MKPYDVVVVGGGPAGASAARALAETGAHVAVIEREAVPRYKSCGGGLPLRTAGILPFPIDSVIEDSVSRLLVSYRGGRPIQARSCGPFAHMVMRARFDALLLQKAATAGAEIVEAAPVRLVERDGIGFRVQSDKGSFRTRFVVGADGANSVVARTNGLGRGMAEAAALEAEVRVPSHILNRWRGRTAIDLGYIPWGYGWLFPKEGRLSVGLILPRSLGGRLRAALRSYLRRLGLGSATIETMVGHKVLFRRAQELIARDGVLLVGDAAGLADEFTAEGIYYAIRSGQLAASALGSTSAVQGSEADAYQRAVEQELMPELRAARTIARLFYGSLGFAPAAVMLWSKHVSYLWNAFFRVQRGESTYDAEVRRALLVAPLARLLLR